MMCAEVLSGLAVEVYTFDLKKITAIYCIEKGKAIADPASLLKLTYLF
jgi:hypothetical protein